MTSLSLLCAALLLAAQPTPPAAPTRPPHGVTPGVAVTPPPADPEESLDLSRANPVERMRFEASRLTSLINCGDAQRFLLVSSFLDLPGDRTLWQNRAAGKVVTPAEYEALPKEEKIGFAERTVTEQEYYYTRYGSPMAYSRPLQILCQNMGGEKAFQGKRVLDYGYGTIGHLRLLALLGVHTVGVDVDPVLRALYALPSDTGEVPGATLFNEQMMPGSVQLVHGSFPGDAAVSKAVGGGFDIILSKNTLKNGYINPAQPVDKRMLVNLGVTPEEFVKDVAGRLNAGGFFMIYNICPAQKPDAYLPWADGRCPFTREQLEGAGLEIVQFDTKDDEAVRRMGRALLWHIGEKPMDLENDLFATYTLCRKK